MASTKDIIVRLLRNLGTRKEVEQYLKQYSTVDAQKFAIIKVGGNILARDLDGLASSLTFLQTVGLIPIVLHGAGPQIDEALAQEGVPSQRVDGLRVTTPRVLEIARRVTLRENLRLVEALEAMGTRTRPVTSGVFEAEIIDPDRLGLVGRVVRIHEGSIQSSLRAGQLPIVTCFGETSSGQIVNLGSDTAVRELSLATQPYKIVFLTEVGGLLGEDGRVISAVNLAEDYDFLMDKEWVHSGMRAKIAGDQEAPRRPPPCLVRVDHLARSPGERALHPRRLRHPGAARASACCGTRRLEGLDRARLRDLLEACFGRALDPAYFEKKAFYRVYLSEAYTATAILTHGHGLPPYLDKFAVTTQAQGAGVGGSLWQRMKAENKKLFWRSRIENEINPWYFQQADGCYKAGRWGCSGTGSRGTRRSEACVDHALALPATLREHGTGEV